MKKVLTQMHHLQPSEMNNMLSNSKKCILTRNIDGSFFKGSAAGPNAFRIVDDHRQCAYCHQYKLTVLCFDWHKGQRWHYANSTGLKDFTGKCIVYEGEMYPIVLAKELVKEKKKWQAELRAKAEYFDLQFLGPEGSVKGELWVSWPPVWVRAGQAQWYACHGNQACFQQGFSQIRSERLLSDCLHTEALKEQLAQNAVPSVFEVENLDQVELLEACLATDFQSSRPFEKLAEIYEGTVETPYSQILQKLLVAQQVFKEDSHYFVSAFTQLAAESNYPWISTDRAVRWVLENDFGIFKMTRRTGLNGLIEVTKSYDLSAEQAQDTETRMRLQELVYGVCSQS